VERAGVFGPHAPPAGTRTSRLQRSSGRHFTPRCASTSSGSTAPACAATHASANGATSAGSRGCAAQASRSSRSLCPAAGSAAFVRRQSSTPPACATAA